MIDEVIEWDALVEIMNIVWLLVMIRKMGWPQGWVAEIERKSRLMKMNRSRKVGIEICMGHSWDDEETTDDDSSKGTNEASVPGARVVSDWRVEAKDQKLAITRWIGGLSHLKTWTSQEQEGNGLECQRRVSGTSTHLQVQKLVGHRRINNPSLRNLRDMWYHEGQKEWHFLWRWSKKALLAESFRGMWE